MPSTLEDGMVVTVEIGFSTTAGSGTVPINSTLASITWTDVTQYVRELSTSRGRSNELDTYSAGSCQVLLDNRTRLFDPENTAGTYYGKLTPLRPIRIRVTPAGGTIRSIFFGFIDQWPQAYSYPNEATVTVTASDAFKVLNEFKLRSYWTTTAISFGAIPSAWYPLADFNGSQYAFEIISWSATSAEWATTTDTPSFCISSDEMIVNDPAKSSALDGTKFLKIKNPLSDATTSYSVGLWIRSTETAPGRYAIFNHGWGTYSVHFGMVVDANGVGTVEAAFTQTGGGVLNVNKTTTTIQVNDGKPHYVVLTNVTAPSTPTTYVDATSFSASTSYAYDTFNYYDKDTIGYPISKSTVAANNFTLYYKGEIQHLAYYDNYQLTAADVLAQYQAGIGTYLQGTRTDQRITTLAGLTGWPSDGFDLGTGDTTVLGINTTGKGLLDALKEVETAEQGRLFMSVDGKIKFVDRNAEGSGNFVTSQATFSDNPGVGEIKYSDIILTYDDRYIYNEIIVTQPNGTSFTASDTISQGKYFKKTLKIDNFIADDGYFVANTALYRLQQYKDPQMRIDQMTVNVRRAAAYQSPCVTLDIGDRITVERTPQDVGAQITKTLIIEGIKHSITRDNWVVTFTTSPTLENAPFVLDSATLGVLDTDLLAY
jgi:hypothetical protein